MRPMKAVSCWTSIVDLILSATVDHVQVEHCVIKFKLVADLSWCSEILDS